VNNPIPPHLQFKKGDKLVCVSTVLGSNLVIGQVYEATEDTEPGNHHTPDPFVWIKGRNGNSVGCYAWRFVKAEAA
jgi:hypothetical protein